MKIGMKIYYDKSTGDVIVNTGERSGDVTETTKEQDFVAYKSLAERTPETVGVLELEYGQYRQDFQECTGYRVNIDTGALEFSYPDPNATPEKPQEPTFQQPMSEEIKAMKTENEALQSRVSDLEITLTEILLSF